MWVYSNQPSRDIKTNIQELEEKDVDDKKWGIPTTNEGMERAGQRFAAASAVLKEMNGWMDRKGAEPPECIIFRATEKGMTPEAYYEWYKSLPFLDPQCSEEQHAIEDRAIQKVQPEWRRNPNPKYPKGW